MAVVQILVGGADVTDSVLFSTANFVSKVNGTAGTADMRVRDDSSSMSFTIGADWLLVIDGDAVWRGFVMQARRVYIFPAMDVAESGLQRFWDLSGSDSNILFGRRYAVKASDPAATEGTVFPAATSDAVAISDLLSNWIDLSTDSIDTSGVTAVGAVDPAQKVQAWGGGTSWGDAMGNIAMMPAAIWYLQPSLSGATLVYCDAETATAPFGLSDVQPSGVPVWSDSFSTPVAHGLGAAYPWVNEDSVTGSAALANLYVDGSSVVFPSAPSASPTAYGTNYESYQLPAAPADGTIRFDFWVPALASQSAGHPTYGVIPPHGAVYVMPSDALGNWSLGTSGAGGAAAPFPAAPAPSSWYTVELVYTAAGPFEARVWPQGGARPASPALAVSVLITTPVAYLDFYWSALGGEDARIDNLVIWDVAAAGAVGPTAMMGYREMEVTLDGTALVNDALEWGAGYGSSAPVFSRTTDAASAAAHGTWQQGDFRTGVYKQATIDRIGSSIVYGSPEHNRGHKDDIAAVTLVTYEPGILAGHVVAFESRVWGFSAALPVREMDITFEAPDAPRYQLMLSQAVDSPWGFYDVSYFQWTVPKMPPIPRLRVPGIPSIGGGIGTAAVIDEFGRVVARNTSSSPRDIGTSTAGFAWSWISSTPVSFNYGCDGTRYYIDAPGSPVHMDQVLAGTWPGAPFLDPVWTFQMKFSVTVVNGTDQSISMNPVSTPVVAHVNTTTGSVTSTAGTISKTDWAANTVYVVEYEHDSTAGMARCRVYEDGMTPPVWQAQASGAPLITSSAFLWTLIWTGVQDHAYTTLLAFVTPTGLPTSGTWGCEGLTRISATVYAASHTFAGGATIVWRSGTLQVFGSDYTEDPARGSITFTSSVGSTEVVRMCYFAVPL